MDSRYAYLYSNDIIAITDEVERCFWGDMNELMLNPEERYEFDSNRVADAIQTYCAEHDCDPTRLHCRMGYYDEDDHWCDWRTLYINSVRIYEMVDKKPKRNVDVFDSVYPFCSDWEAADYWEERILIKQERYWED